MTILGIQKNLFLTITVSLVFHLVIIFGVLPGFTTQAGQAGELRLVVSFGTMEMPVESEEPVDVPEIESLPETDTLMIEPKPIESDPRPEVTPVQTNPGSPELTAGEIEDTRTSYLRKVVARIQRAKRYPAFARRRNLEASVKVEFVIAGNGEVVSVKMLAASRYDILDKEALAMIRRAAPFPPIPQELGKSEMKLPLWITFKLEK